MEILWKGTVSVQSFHTRKLGENTVFYTVLEPSLNYSYWGESKVSQMENFGTT